MRYSFEQLQGAIEERRGSDAIKEMIEGYPLLHSLLIELRDERNDNQRERWWQLLRTLLDDNYVDINVRSKHNDCPLHSIVKEHNPEHALSLLQLFLDKGADPNLVDANQQTALEVMVANYPADDSIVQILMRATIISDELKVRCQKQLNTAIEQYEPTTINTLLDLHLARSPSPYHEDRRQEPLWFRQGAWLRIITCPEQERERLDKRENLTPEQLRGFKPDDGTDLLYTRYSSATFVKSGIPVSTFGLSQKGGIIIRQANRCIEYWYDGKREELTCDWRFNVGDLLTHGPRAQPHEHHQVEENQLSNVLATAYQQYIAYDLGRGVDRHGVLKSRPYYCSMSWNEGLFRYQQRDIIGFFIEKGADPENILSVLQLKKALDLRLRCDRFYVYDNNTGGMSPCLTQAELLHTYPIQELPESQESLEESSYST